MNAMPKATKVRKSQAARRREAIRYAEGSIAHLAPGVSLADELIADRRAEGRAGLREQPRLSAAR
jgi:hypothetical protein